MGDCIRQNAQNTILNWFNWTKVFQHRATALSRFHISPVTNTQSNVVCKDDMHKLWNTIYNIYSLFFNTNLLHSIIIHHPCTNFLQFIHYIRHHNSTRFHITWRCYFKVYIFQDDRWSKLKLKRTLVIRPIFRLPSIIARNL